MSPRAQNTQDLPETSVDNVDVVGLIRGEKKPPPPEVVKAQLQEQGRNWLYGHGVGRTILNVGTVIAFPPYGLFLLGNAGLQIAGYQPVDVTKAFPEKVSKPLNIAYDEITSVPGRLNAVVAGEQFRDKQINDTLSASGEVPTDNQLSIIEEDLEF
jgi:hypothetical protein